jgi:HAD superfamily hydrolase (TIGR01662 family)
MKLSYLPPNILFDLDNTLADRNTAMRKTMEHWLALYPSDNYSLDTIMELDAEGYNDRTVFCNWLLQHFDTEFQNSTLLLAFIQQQIVTHLQPEKAILQLLSKLKLRFRLILASNGSSTTQRAKLRQCGLESFFHENDIFISGEMAYEKPATGFFTTILDKLGLDAAETIMIGDDLINDIQAAQQCGLHTCWVSNNRINNETTSNETTTGDGTTNNKTIDLVIPHITALEQWI